MKNFLLGCFFILFGMSHVFGEESNIDLAKGDWSGSTRSLSVEPTATYDENVVHIYYDDYLLENLQITVKDSSGNIVYYNMVSVSYNQPYSFSLGNVESGEYMLELKSEENLYYGNFIVL